MERKEINARLEAVREQLAALSVEVSEISNAAPYKLGSRVSYVSDRIKQAVEDINACLEFPERWRVEEQAGIVTVWDTAGGVRVPFQPWGRVGRLQTHGNNAAGQTVNGGGYARIRHGTGGVPDVGAGEFPRRIYGGGSLNPAGRSDVLAVSNFRKYYITEIKITK